MSTPVDTSEKNSKISGSSAPSGRRAGLGNFGSGFGSVRPVALMTMIVSDMSATEVNIDGLNLPRARIFSNAEHAALVFLRLTAGYHLRVMHEDVITTAIGLDETESSIFVVKSNAPLHRVAPRFIAAVMAKRISNASGRDIAQQVVDP